MLHVGLEIGHGVKLMIVQHVSGHNEYMVQSRDQYTVGNGPLVRAEEGPGVGAYILVYLA